jgi:glycosyltransferase involved in cell wall biosynthesis
MKVLQICPAYYPAVSIGGPIYSTLTFSELIAKDNQLTTLTTQLGLDLDQLQNIEYNKEIKLSDNHTIIYKKYYGYPHFTFSITTFFWLLKELKNFDLIVLQGIWNFPFIIASIFSRLHKKKYILFPHGQLYSETFYLKSSGVKKIFYYLFIKTMLKNATYIIFTTFDEQSKVGDFLNIPLKSLIIPNVVKKSDFELLEKSSYFKTKYGISENTKLLLHFGRISKKKGLEFTILALKKLLDCGYDVKLLVVGGDEEGYKKHIDSLILKLDLSNVVYFTGLLDRVSSKMALNECDIFILPSYSENFGISVAEAMLCGLPVIISDRVGISFEINENNAGIVIDFNNIQYSLPKAIENLLLNVSFRKEIGENGKQFAINNYDVCAIESKFQELMNNLNI